VHGAFRFLNRVQKLKELSFASNRRVARGITGAVHARGLRAKDEAGSTQHCNSRRTWIAIADGFPPGDPSAFLVFDGDGHELWQYPTTDMNWPIAINREGTVLAACSDDGKLYYFDL